MCRFGMDGPRISLSSSVPVNHQFKWTISIPEVRLLISFTASSSAWALFCTIISHLLKISSLNYKGSLSLLHWLEYKKVAFWKLHLSLLLSVKTNQTFKSLTLYHIKNDQLIKRQHSIRYWTWFNWEIKQLLIFMKLLKNMEKFFHFNYCLHLH